MSNNFSFNAPTYFDFNPQNINENDDTLEMYFEIGTSSKTCSCDPLATDTQCICTGEKNNEIEAGSKEKCSDSPKDETTMMCFSTPRTEICQEINDSVEDTKKLRRSLSTGNLHHVGTAHSQNVKLGSSSNLNTNLYNFSRHKSSSRDRINQLALPKQNQSKYSPSAKKSKPLCATIPHSPALGTRHRQRHNQILTTEEIELLEINEHKKLMKPLPLNPKILQGPMKPINPYKKSSTVVKPFNLTACPTKQVVQTKNQQTQQPTSRTAKSNPATEACRPTATQLAPFSFESRDKQLAKRREEKLNRILEEEKNARKFRANPMPKYQPPKGCVKKSSSLNSLKSSKSEDSNDAPKAFKAKPPTVLYKKPFEPAKPDRSLIEVTEFYLNSERRAKDREEYDKRILEKQNRLAIDKARREQEEKMENEMEIINLRILKRLISERTGGEDGK
ncbi:Targeting protein for Xklp2 (TPX2) domain [Popillia japonica]|uniref:Targeting protein for Xklp2 (TPX2) domain n=1 Tax=Popillia japonica TaxID=7064 RepID=A0AAW1KQA1_POPJA